MLQELDLTLNNRKATFVDLNMQFGGPALHSEYGKLLFKQQAYIRHHEVHNLFGVNVSTMQMLALDSITAVVSVKNTPTTEHTGHWKILISDANILTTLNAIDRALSTLPQTFPATRPNRQQKAIELMPVANQNAWLHQNKDFTATPPSQTKRMAQT